MPTVHEDMDLPGGTAPLAEVRITLAGEGCRPFSGTTPPDVRLLGERILRQGVEIDANGYWEINLVGNADVNPAGTVYRVSRRLGNAYPTIDTCISVPAAGGPYAVSALQVDPPGDLPDSGTGLAIADLQSRVAVLETGHGDVITNTFTGDALGASPPSAGGFGTDVRGLLTWGTGVGPTAGNMAGVTYSSPYSSPPRVVISPINAVTVPLGLYVSQTQVWGFVVGAASAPAGSQPADTYAVNYLAVWE
jgi:hypothetical protein